MLMKIEMIYIGSYKFGCVKLCDTGHKYVTVTSIRNYWMRARRLDRLALEKAIATYRMPVFSIDCISIDDFKMVLCLMLSRYDGTARSITASYLNKCLAVDSSEI